MSNGFHFDKDDGQVLKSMGRMVRSLAFDPMDFYFYACRANNVSYARTWEAFNSFKPWVANQAFAPEHCTQDDASVNDVVMRQSCRVATGMSVLMPEDFAETEPEMSCYGDRQV